MATLLRVRPTLLPRLAYAPRRAIHAIGAFLHLALQADLPDSEVASLLDERDPRDLLRTAIPDAPAALYRALDRAGDHVRERTYYERLATLCSTSLIDDLLSGDALDGQRLAWAERLLAMDPALLSLPHVLSHPAAEVEAIGTLIAYLRSQNAFADHGLRVEKGAGLPAVVRRLQKSLDRVAAPETPFALPPPLRVLQTIGDLRETGVRLGNCVAQFHAFGCSHWFRLARGSSVYVTSDAPPMLAVLRRVGPDLWLLEELAGLKNEDVGPDSRARLTDALRAAGVCLLQQDPSRALARLGRHVGQPQGDEADLEDDLAA